MGSHFLMKIKNINNIIKIINKYIDIMNNMIYNMNYKEVINIKKFKMPSDCPVCKQKLEISRLTCPSCNTKLDGDFVPCKFCRLPDEQLEFVETFIKCRGSIKDVEKELGISYPTVKNKLDLVINALGYKQSIQTKNSDEDYNSKILEALEKGEIDSEHAIKLLKNNKE